MPNDTDHVLMFCNVNFAIKNGYYYMGLFSMLVFCAPLKHISKSSLVSWHEHMGDMYVKIAILRSARTPLIYTRLIG